ncbi:hypothetical protein BJ878DRAFT_463042 [Calycina marina]|uniref:Enoyl reductase (ER) domain-containing protein n=1 Tax=Calycina marina TaxID=1763456 RepID=A0A9P7Z0I0_9HELO|nr:hypothetical protein BJ878DRAFT_463042 [Calycina marina]
MAPNKALIFAKHPETFPVPGEHLIVKTTDFDLDASPPAGGLILKTNHISYDPYLRGKMKPPNPGSYTPGFEIGKPIYNNAISTVVASDNPRFKKGDVVIGYSNFEEYVKVPKERADKDQMAYSVGLSLLENSLGLDPKIFLGALGMSGLTAYSSLYEIGHPKKGQTIFVSAASGAVGQIVGQLAKREGLKVLGSVGSAEKLEFVTKRLGFDGGFNYKTEKPEDALKRLLKEVGSESIDIYYDNVGGEQLDASISLMTVFGRIVCCGSVSQTSKTQGERNLISNIGLVVGKRLTIRGFLVTDKDFASKYWEEHQTNVQKWIKEGNLTVKSSVTEGIDNGAEGFLGMLKGENFGKAILTIAEL